MKATYSYWRMGVTCAIVGVVFWNIGYYAAIAGYHWTTGFVLGGK